MSATKSGNGLQKTSNIVLSGSCTIFAFFLDFSVAFVVRLLKILVNKRDLRDYPSNGVGNGVATSSATGVDFLEWNLYLLGFFLGQLMKTVRQIRAGCR